MPGSECNRLILANDFVFVREREAPMQVPKAKVPCDPVTEPCPCQVACFREQPESEIGELELYQLRGDAASARSSRQQSPHRAIEATAQGTSFISVKFGLYLVK